MRIIIGLICFGFIVLIHELGHFIFAKKGGIKVHEFAIGMGPKLLTKKIGETDYSIRVLPIGGFVAMEGEDEQSQDEDAFGNVSWLNRFLTVFGGPLFNIILSFLLFTLFFGLVGSPTNKIEKVRDNSPASKIELKKGDEIVEIGNTKINEYNDIGKVLGKNGSKETTLVLNRNGEKITKQFTPEYLDGKYVLGFYPANEKSFLGSIKVGAATTVDNSKMIFDFLGKLVTGKLPKKVMKSISGPVGVLNIVSQASKQGILSLILITAVLSINIGIMNLLPFPALDGWRILMLLIEALRGGKKFNPEKEGLVNFIGLGLLMAIMILVTYNDIIKIFFKK